MGFRSVYLLPIFVLVRVETVPPEACFANFRWDDCGKSPVPVMYYWKPGSRCEVGLWRGCLPNLNMFTDEYDCVTTCIFAARGLPELYHSMNENEIEGKPENSTEAAVESVNSTDAATGHVTSQDHATGAVTVASGGGGNGETTVAGGQGTTDGGHATATTAAPAA